MRRAPGLLLLLALFGGLGASWIHGVHHAAEWAEAQTSHAADHHAADGDVAQAPCVDGDAHTLDCAVCSGLNAATLARFAETPSASMDTDRQRAAVEAHADFRRAVAPARGPPAVA